MTDTELAEVLEKARRLVELDDLMNHRHLTSREVAEFDQVVYAWPVAISRALLALAERTTWQPIETARKRKDVSVLLWSEICTDPVLGWWDDGDESMPAGWWSAMGDFTPSGEQPTHWQALPEGPKP